MPHIGNFPERGFPKPLSIPPSEFVPREDTFDYVCDGLILKNRTTLTLQDFSAPVYLPNKATITKLTLYGYRTSAGSGLNLALSRLNRVGHGQEMARVTADWTDGYGSKSDDAISYPVIDNENYSYGLELDIDPDADVGDCLLNAAVIEWR